MQRNEAYVTLLEANTNKNKTNKQKQILNRQQKNLIDLLKCCYRKTTTKKQTHTAAPK